MAREITEERFLADVALHEMTVLKEDGLFRHLRFQRPTTWNMGFHVTTWPGYLCISGDMGCYVFSRLPDMFAFFRNEFPGKTGLYINPSYWGEKVQAVDRNAEIEEYSPDVFREAVLRILDDAEASTVIREAAADQVLTRADDGHHEAVRAAMTFECDGFAFDSFYEVGVTEYSHRFLWCCYAVAWAVMRYDGRPKTEPESPADGR